MRPSFACCTAVFLAAVALAACAAPTPGPTTWLDRPLDGDRVPLSPLTIQAHASDADGVASFEFFVGDTVLATVPGGGGRLGEATAGWTPPAPGTYTVRARAIDSQGNVGPEARSQITVEGLRELEKAPGVPTNTPTPAPAPGPTNTPTPAPGPTNTPTPAPGPTNTPTTTPTVTMTPPPACPGPPVIAYFTADPSTINAGQSSTLSWGLVSNATSAAIDQGIGGVGTPGSHVVSPATTTTYTMAATGCGGTTTQQATVVVIPAPGPQPPPPGPQPPPPAPDTTPPEISGLGVSPAMIQRADCGTPNTTTVSATVTDAGGVNRVVARILGFGEVEMSLVGGNLYQAVLGPFSDADTY